MDLEEKNQMEGPNENVIVEKRKRSTLSRFFSFKNLSEFNENASTTSDDQDRMSKDPKTNSLLRMRSKKQEELQPETSQNSNDPQTKQGIFSRVKLTPWLNRKVSKMYLNRSKEEEKSEMKDEPKPCIDKMSTEEIHEILLAN